MNEEQIIEAILSALSEKKDGKGYLAEIFSEIGMEKDLDLILYYQTKLHKEGLARSRRGGRGTITFLTPEGRKWLSEIDDRMAKSNQEQLMFDLTIKDLQLRVENFENQTEFWNESAKTSKNQRKYNRVFLVLMFITIVISVISLLLSIGLIRTWATIT